MIKFLDILKESDDNIFIPRGSKEEKDKVLTKKDYDKIQEYIRNGSEGDLILMYSQIEKLPDNFTVNGTLDLQRCKNLQSLPNGLKVTYDLDLRRTNITSLPSDLEVGRDLILMHSQIEKLPDNLTVNGNLDLDGCKNLQSLPNGLKVKNNLHLRDTNITSLPSDLEVGGDLALYRTPIANRYTKEQIREMVPGVKGGIYL